MKYHIKPDGSTGVCTARIRCPYGDASAHYETQELADQASQSNMKSKFGVLGKQMSKAEAKAEIVDIGRTMEYLYAQNEAIHYFEIACKFDHKKYESSSKVQELKRDLKNQIEAITNQFVDVASIFDESAADFPASIEANNHLWFYMEDHDVENYEALSDEEYNQVVEELTDNITQHLGMSKEERAKARQDVIDELDL